MFELAALLIDDVEIVHDAPARNIVDARVSRPAGGFTSVHYPLGESGEIYLLFSGNNIAFQSFSPSGSSIMPLLDETLVESPANARISIEQDDVLVVALVFPNGEDAFAVIHKATGRMEIVQSSFTAQPNSD